MEKVKINDSYELEPGDIIELHFKTIGMAWLRYAHVAMIEKRLLSKKEFTLLSVEHDKNKIIITVRIKRPAAEGPQLQTASITAAGLVAIMLSASLLVWLTRDAVYKVIDSPAAKIAVGGGAGTMALAAGIGAILTLFGKK